MPSGKVVWSRGLFLLPQHFQQQDRYVESLLEARVHPMLPYSYGFSTLRIDEAALRHGTLAIEQASGVMPDGTPFSIPDRDAAPPPLQLQRGTREGEYFLALALRGSTGRDLRTGSDDAQSRQRYAVRELTLPDSTDGGSDALVQVGGLRFQLLSNIDDRAGVAVLGATRINGFDSDGQVLTDPHYIPTVLSVAASARLSAALVELAATIKHRAAVLSERISAPGRRGLAEVSDFIYLQTLNRHQPVLAHLAVLPALHPERLFCALLGLAGDLACYASTSRSPVEFAHYNHMQLEASFTPLLAEVRALLAWEPERRAVSIEIQERKHGFRVALLPEAALARTAEFVLAVGADVPAAQVANLFPHEAKVASLHRIQELVAYSLPGVQLQALPVAPRQITYHAGFSYFRLDRGQPEHWTDIEQATGLAIHVPDKYPGLVLELWAIRS